VVAKQRIGSTPPAVPVLVVHSVLDDIVPFAQDQAMARSWCAEWATVQLNALTAPTHVGGGVEAYPLASPGWTSGCTVCPHPTTAGPYSG
jgi:Secretory lipase